MGFKVGDIIKGKNKRYMFTNKSIKKAKVLIANENYMEIEIIEHCWEFLEGERYIVRNSTKYFELIEEKEFTKSDLQDEDIVTLRNGVKYRKSGNTIQTSCAIISLENFTENLKDSTNSNEDTDIIKVERPTRYETVYERVEEDKKEILDETEREYLKAVIKPFKKRVKFIRKTESNMLFEKELLLIQLNDDDLILPYFEKEMMYKGMELSKKYTLEELGL